MSTASIAAPALPAADETGLLGVRQLKRLWAAALAARAGRPVTDRVELQLNHLILDALGLGLQQAQEYLIQRAPGFAEFERWILATTGGVDAAQVARINAVVTGGDYPESVRRQLAAIEAMPPVLSADDLAHWAEHGYVIVPDAVPEDSRHAATEAIWQRVNGQPDNPDTWYAPNDHGIMVQFFQHPAFTANRRSPRIHKAFAQLWGTADLWVTTDRAGFNAPERPGHLFRGPDLHWDVSLVRPIPFGTQGILYLTDTLPEQGAFTCVPGFQRRIDAWLDRLPPGRNPRQEDLHALGSRPIAGRAGDLVIWDHKLPHGSRPNRSTQPRIVQYVNMYPTRRDERVEWL